MEMTFVFPMRVTMTLTLDYKSFVGSQLSAAIVGLGLVDTDDEETLSLATLFRYRDNLLDNFFLLLLDPSEVDDSAEDETLCMDFDFDILLSSPFTPTLCFLKFGVIMLTNILIRENGALLGLIAWVLELSSVMDSSVNPPSSLTSSS